MALPIEIVNGYVEKYNAARQSGDVENAIGWGKLAVRDANEELKKPNLIVAHRTYYQTVVKNIGEFLKNPTAAKPAAVGKTEGKDDKIKSTDWFSAPIPNLSFKDIAGLEDVKNEFIINVFAPLSPKYASIYRKYRGDELGMQVLLYGPPGTGKTHIVKCLAGELKCKICIVKISDVMANLVGDGAKIIAEIFEQAKQYDRCIIFFDEIDSIACDRESDDSRYTKEQLTTLLTNMDGFTSQTRPGQIRIVIAATNRPFALDSAVKRGGRFDTQIYVPLPDKEARKTMVSRALGKDASVKNRVDIPCADDVTVEWLAEKFEGYSGADIKAICRQAANRPLAREIRARTQGREEPDRITREDFEIVFERYINSITDDMLIQFDAYRLNMQYGGEYVRLKSEQVIKDLWAKREIEPFVLRWFKELCECGYVWENFKNKYDLSFLENEYGFKLLKPDED